MTRTRQYRLTIAAGFAILAIVTAIRTIANATGFPLAGAAMLLVLAGLAVLTAVRDRPWVVGENIVLAILIVMIPVSVFLPRP
jgi:hypothetical protein